VKCLPGDVNALLELSQVLLLVGDNENARQYLSQAQALDPQNEMILNLIKQADASAQPVNRQG
jgi:uncharacterized protein HemY